MVHWNVCIIHNLSYALWCQAFGLLQWILQKQPITPFLRMYDLSHILNFATGIQNGLITAVANIFVHNEILNLSFTSAIVNGCIRQCLPSFLQLIIFCKWQKWDLKHRIQINDKTILNFQILLENGTRESVSKDTDTNIMFSLIFVYFLEYFLSKFSH